MKCPLCDSPLEANGCPYHTTHEVFSVLTAQRDRLAKVLRVVADRHEHGQPIPSSEIAAAMADLEKNK